MLGTGRPNPANSSLLGTVINAVRNCAVINSAILHRTLTPDTSSRNGCPEDDLTLSRTSMSRGKYSLDVVRPNAGIMLFL